MPNNGEIIEKLARQLEQQKILNDLQDCETLEDFKKLTEKYEAICKNQS
ncbi:MAG: protein phosphatase [Lachnospiraceae bacterium]|nr:protein phosphatase [Ruminococcus sp.]MCM1275125.1 protein phosphatase [Lachnospiraceae bacterium]